MAQKSNDEFDQLMELAKYEDLMSFIRDQARDNLVFRKELTAFLGKKYLRSKTTITDYRGKMSAAFNEYTDMGDRWHSYEVTDWGAVSDNVSHLLNEGKRLLDLGNADAAATIAVEFFTVLEQEFSVDDLYEDSEEYELGKVCEQAQELIQDAFTSPYINKTVRSKLMNTLREISSSSLPYDLNNYGIYDYDDMMLKVGKVMMTDDERLQMLDQQIAQHNGRYDQHTYVCRKIDLLRELNRETQALAEQQRFIHLPEVRNLAIDQCVEQGYYDIALRLAHDGITLANELNHSGTARSWRKKELAIYEHKGDKENQIKICRELFIDGNADMEYYRKLKALIPSNQWKSYLAQLLDEVKGDGGFGYIGHSNKADIYVEEEDGESLFRLISKKSHMNLDMLNRYAQHVGSNHAGELLDSYTLLLKQLAERQVNAKAYQRIADAMSCMTRLKNGKHAAHQLATYFRQTYSRRPNMMAQIKGF